MNYLHADATNVYFLTESLPFNSGFGFLTGLIFTACLCALERLLTVRLDSVSHKLHLLQEHYNNPNANGRGTASGSTFDGATSGGGHLECSQFRDCCRPLSSAAVRNNERGRKERTGVFPNSGGPSVTAPATTTAQNSRLKFPYEDELRSSPSPLHDLSSTSPSNRRQRSDSSSSFVSLAISSASAVAARVSNGPTGSIGMKGTITSSSDSSLARLVLQKAVLYWLASLLRLLYMLLAMSFHIGVLLVVVSSLAISQLCIDVYKTQSKSSSLQASSSGYGRLGMEVLDGSSSQEDLSGPGRHREEEGYEENDDEDEEQVSERVYQLQNLDRNHHHH